MILMGLMIMGNQFQKHIQTSHLHALHVVHGAHHGNPKACRITSTNPKNCAAHNHQSQLSSSSLPPFPSTTSPTPSTTPPSSSKAKLQRETQPNQTGNSEMVRTGKRLPSFCLNRVATRVRVRSPPIESKRITGAVDGGQLLSGYCPGESEKCRLDGDGGKQSAAATTTRRRIMVVVDSSKESKCALQWAVSHTVQAQDTILLLGVTRPSKNGDSQGRVDPRSYEPLQSMKNMCQARKPGVQVEVSLVEAKERGPAIVEEARKQQAALLVLGQKKRSLTWRLVMLWAGGRVGGGGGSNVVDYCIQNAGCMALAVRRKGRAAGGYLITTRRHKDFWLLA